MRPWCLILYTLIKSSGQKKPRGGGGLVGGTELRLEFYRINVDLGEVGQDDDSNFSSILFSLNSTDSNRISIRCVTMYGGIDYCRSTLLTEWVFSLRNAVER